MTSILLGLGSGVVWGTADFFGGLQSRRFPALSVAFWSQLVGAVALLLCLPLLGGLPTPAAIMWGLLAGLFGGSGLIFFYRALAGGVMSVVAPVSACGAIVPVIVGAAMGERPGALAWAGMLTAFAGIVLVSLQPEAPSGPDRRVRGSRWASLLQALGAALGFGLFFVLVDRGTDTPNASALWVIAGARASSLPWLFTIGVVSRDVPRWPGPSIVPIGIVGIMDTAANALFALASAGGTLGVVSVLGSLYPVATVLLGRVVLQERLNRSQLAGVVLALLGVAMLAGG